MLNELYSLSKSLTSMDIEVNAKSSNFVTCSKNKDSVIAYLKADGTFEFEKKAPKETKNYCKYQPNNQTSFPAINLTILNKRKDNIKKVSKINKFADNFIEDIVTPSEPSSLLVERVKKLEHEQLLNELYTWAEINFKEILSEKEFILIFELHETENQFHSISNYEFINNALLNSNKSSNIGIGRDAFGEPLTGDEDDPMPRINIPVLGPSILMMNYGQVPCNYRYGYADRDTFPISTTTRQNIVNSLSWIGDPNKKNETWTQINDKFTGPSVLFVYPSKITEQTPFASIFNTPIKDDTTDFIDASQKVIDAITKIKSNNLNPDIVIFGICKDNKQSRHVIFSHRYSIDNIEKSVNEWNKACENIAKELGQKYDKTTKSFLPIHLLPEELVFLSSKKYNKDSSLKDTYIGASSVECIELFLENKHVDKFLNIFIEQYQKIISEMWEIKNRKNKNLLPIRMSKFLVTLGILLYKNGITKEIYMESVAFKLGQLITLHNIIHREYCTHVRNGDAPAELIGSLFQTMMMENPQKTLPTLAKRAKPYTSWATSPKFPHEKGIAKWALRKMNDLDITNIPKTFSSAEKAEFVLGFLSNVNKENKND